MATSKETTETSGADQYVLRRDYAGSSRLNLQFYLWKSSLGFTLHPSIPRPASGARVADIATGTGIWLVDLSQTVPSEVQLDGFDISVDQYPPAPWLPTNVNLKQWDMYSDPPEYLLEQYDIVHVRLIMLAMKDGDPMPIIRNLRKLLKPTGYLQWEEVNRDESHIARAHPDAPANAIEMLFLKDMKTNQWKEAKDSWQSRLVTDLNSNGFEEAMLYTYKPEPAIARHFHDMYMTAFDEYMDQVSPGQREMLARVVGGAVQEARNGAIIAFPMLIWVARAV